MNDRNSISIFILLLAAGFLCLNAVLAAPPTKVTVKSASPNSALQGDALSVDISGSGFDLGSKVKFLVTGTKDDTQISVVSVVLNPDGTLTASIQVLGTAIPIDYDIEVRASSGRRGKGTTLFKVNQVGGGGSVDPTFDVLFDRDMKGSGMDWIQPNNSAKNIRYFFHDHEHIGTGEIGLGYFTVPNSDGGPFPGTDGENCFGTDDGTDPSTQVVQGMISQTNSGAAVVGILFVGKTKTEDGQTTLDYSLNLEGTFAKPYDWTPEEENTVILTSWNLRVAHKKERKKFSNISCEGGGVFDALIYVVRN